MDGLHVVSDMSGCSGLAMSDAGGLSEGCVRACREAGLTVVAVAFHQFEDPSGKRMGATGAVVLAESHLTVHTWPETGRAAVDAYVCNHTRDNSQRARDLVASVAILLSAKERSDMEVSRGAVEDGLG